MLNMSIGSFLKKMWDAVRKFFGSIGEEAKQVIVVAHDIVENIKAFVYSPGMDVLTAIIPTDIDNKIVDVLRAALPRILTSLTNVDEVLNMDKDKELAAAIYRINEAPEEVRKVFYHGLASLITELVSDGELSWSDSVAIQEYYYKFK
jgi:hypothetical protein